MHPPLSEALFDFNFLVLGSGSVSIASGMSLLHLQSFLIVFRDAVFSVQIFVARRLAAPDLYAVVDGIQHKVQHTDKD
jgi:hypothetical protein